MVQMNFIFIFISSSNPNLLGKKSVKQKIKKMMALDVNFPSDFLFHVNYSIGQMHKLTLTFAYCPITIVKMFSKSYCDADGYEQTTQVFHSKQKCILQLI